MNNNLEIEFKTLISEEKYNELMDIFYLTESKYEQINHYFDTPDLSLYKENNMLRIRCKPNRQSYKLTSKVRQGESCLETHVILNEEDIYNMIDYGFNASFIGIDLNVEKICELTTIRAKCPYKNGMIFLDKSIYGDVVEYEVEYEVDSYDEGKREFNQFIDEYNIEFKDSISKSGRAFEQAIKKMGK